MIGKYLVIGALLAGILAFFMPFLTMYVPNGADKIEITFSAMNMLGGNDAVAQAIADQSSTPVAAADVKKLEEVFTALAAVLLIPFVPTFFFLIATLVGLKRFGRGMGVLSLLAGLLGLGGWAILNAVGQEAGDKASFGLGLTLLLVGALLGTVGGIMGIAKPQPKAA